MALAEDGTNRALSRKAGSESIPLPNFFVIGAAKCGTTALHGMLGQHPEVFVTAEKETHFFDYRRRYERGVDAWLETHYQRSRDFLARGESTPSYLHRGEYVIARMLETYAARPSPRLICLLRDPVARCRSHYLDMVRSTFETESLERALELEVQRLARGGRVRWQGYFRDGLYARQLEPWIDAFGRDSLLVLLSEDLRAHPRELLDTVFEFLGVRRDVTIQFAHRANVASVYRSRSAAMLVNRPSWVKSLARRLLPASATRRIRDWLEHTYREPVPGRDIVVMSDGLRNELRARYREDIEQLEALIQRDLSSWKQT